MYQKNTYWYINVTSRVLTRKTDPPSGRHFHEDWTINVASKIFYCRHIMKTAPPPIKRTNVVTKLHEDWTIHVTYRVLTGKTDPHPGGHVFQLTKTIFQLGWDNIENKYIIRAKLCTKFHEDQTINVASRVFTSQNVDDARRTKGDPKISVSPSEL
ncbi:hypothetical protein DPMN_140177 [Dreissena polymorpha]|uniref:Uncharacterized protein n=1 Tax=Dreissena polymorpha TaxID=45954 RepID=A0A9D4JLI1_DREPO|nr:hypothetical protein DPMN_140177 [Dreissena polymorpha]